MNPITRFLLPLVTWVLMRTFEGLIAMRLKGNICLLYYITTKIKISMPIVLIIFTKCYRLLRN